MGAASTRLRGAASTPLAAVFRAEVLFNLKRVAPYALMILFSANAVLWWGWGPAVTRGWAVNSDFYIVWLFCGFSFLTTPLFIALMMGDPVIRDYRLRVDPLIFSKPVSRGEYLLGKFFGNFFVLVCCQACFALTPLLLQAFSTEGMLVQPPRVLPYLQHFLFFVVVSSLALAAVFFTVGTLTRNVKVVYGLAVCFYPLYIAWQLTLKSLPAGWRITLDPLLFNAAASTWQGRSADWLNHLAVVYDRGMVANRLTMVGFALACLALLYLRFSTSERGGGKAETHRTSILELEAMPERLDVEAEGYDGATHARGEVDRQEFEHRDDAAVSSRPSALPRVEVFTEGRRASASQFAAALGVEFRLFRAERSLVVVAPLAVFVCVLELATFGVVQGGSYSAAYAGRTADSLLLFLFGVAVFYAGEAMHRDRELRVEPVLWSAPAPDLTFLLPKFAATLLLSLSLVAPVAVAAVALQVYKGHTPLEPLTYLKTYALILLPSIIFMCAASVASNVLLRDKYLAYAVSLAAGGAVYYLASQGGGGWLYNPVLYNLWTPADLAGGERLARILAHRVYCLALSGFLLALAFVVFERRSAGGSKSRHRLGGRGRAILLAAVCALAAVAAGLLVGKVG
jgi:ABC-type transport system involved in multi-copper enzyme maturation permease subunit